MRKKRGKKGCCVPYVCVANWPRTSKLILKFGWQYLKDLWFFLNRLNCPEAAMRSLQLARQHAASEHERLVYEGWILYDTGHCEEGLHKAEESISIQRSFEAFFLKAYALADSSPDSSSSATVVSLLEDALKCPSDRLRKGQVCVRIYLFFISLLLYGMCTILGFCWYLNFVGLKFSASFLLHFLSFFVFFIFKNLNSAS